MMTTDTMSYTKIYNSTPEDNQHVTKKKKNPQKDNEKYPWRPC